MAKETRHVIFDFDGTIADSFNLGLKLINQLAEKHNFRPVYEADIDRLRNLSMLERLKALNISLYQIPRIAQDIFHIYSKSLKSVPLFEGMEEVILELKQKGMTMSIVSSNSSENIRKFLIDNNLNVFDHIYCAKNIFGKDKTIASLIRKLNLKRSELIYVGDEYRDIAACHSNHIKVIAVTWGYDNLRTLAAARPDYIVDQPSQLVPVILGE